MKKVLSIALIVASLALLAPARAGATVSLLDAVVTNVSSTPQVIQTATQVTVQVRSASTSVVVATIETSLDQLTWTTAATITNPTSTGEIYNGPGGGFLRVTLSGYISGTITVKATAVRGADTLF